MRCAEETEDEEGQHEDEEDEILVRNILRKSGLEEDDDDAKSCSQLVMVTLGGALFTALLFLLYVCLASRSSALPVSASIGWEGEFGGYLGAAARRSHGGTMEEGEGVR